MFFSVVPTGLAGQDPCVEEEKTAAKVKSGDSSGRHGLTFDEGLDKFDDFGLLLARQARDLFEHLPDSSGWPAGLDGLESEQCISCNTQGGGEGNHLFRLECDGASFPMCNDTAINADLVGQLGLREADTLTGVGQSCAEIGSLVICWSSCSHARIIRHV